MPAKSVIQLTAIAHKGKLDELLVASENMVRATGCIPVALPDILAFENGVKMGWEMATFHILSSGNCAFERGE